MKNYWVSDPKEQLQSIYDSYWHSPSAHRLQFEKITPNHLLVPLPKVTGVQMFGDPCHYSKRLFSQFNIYYHPFVTLNSFFYLSQGGWDPKESRHAHRKAAHSSGKEAHTSGKAARTSEKRVDTPYHSGKEPLFNCYLIVVGFWNVAQLLWPRLGKKWLHRIYNNVSGL